MNEPSSDLPPAKTAVELPRADQARGVAMGPPTGEILRQLMTRERDGLFSDAILARCNAMIGNLSRQLLLALGEAAEQNDLGSFVAEHEEALSQALMTRADLLGHCHAAAVEGILTDRLHEDAAIDPSVSPVLKALLSSDNGDLAGAAMHVLAAQSRFLHTSRRMELPLAELPAELFHFAATCLAEQDYADQEAVVATRKTLFSQYDEGAARIAQITRLALDMSDDTAALSRLTEAGVAIFATALALECGQLREHTILAMGQKEPAQFVVMMRAADLPPAAVSQALATLHPHVDLDPALSALSSQEAAQMLNASASGEGV